MHLARRAQAVRVRERVRPRAAGPRGAGEPPSAGAVCERRPGRGTCQGHVACAGGGRYPRGRWVPVSVPVPSVSVVSRHLGTTSPVNVCIGPMDASV